MFVVIDDGRPKNSEGIAGEDDQFGSPLNAPSWGTRMKVTRRI